MYYLLKKQFKSPECLRITLTNISEVHEVIKSMNGCETRSLMEEHKSMFETTALGKMFRRRNDEVRNL